MTTRGEERTGTPPEGGPEDERAKHEAPGEGGGEAPARVPAPTPEEAPELLGERSDYPIAWDPDES